MESLFNSKSTANIVERLHHLSSTSLPLWGEMSVAEMLAHCQKPLAVATGHLELKHSLMGKLLGGFAKKSVLNDKPFKKGLPTAKEFKVESDHEDFSTEKARLIEMVEQFHLHGANGVTNKPHPFFGKLKPEEWSTSLFKHLDHHLQQFGV